MCAVCSGWSAPSAIGIAGLGGGFEIGVEVSRALIKITFARFQMVLESILLYSGVRPGHYPEPAEGD